MIHYLLILIEVNTVHHRVSSFLVNQVLMSFNFLNLKFSIRLTHIKMYLDSIIK